MKLACARADYGTAGVLHFVSRASQCRGKGKTLVEFAKDGPVRVCRKEHGTAARRRGLPGVRAPAGSIRLVDGPGRCAPTAHPNETAQSLPTGGDLRFCARRGSNSLRWSNRCRENEYTVLLPQRKRGSEPRAPVAANDRAATDEDTAERVDLLANDTAATRSRPLRVTAVDTGATNGRVTLDESGNVTYDPTGRLDRLKPGGTVTDRFAYTVTDGVRRDRATAYIEVGGVNDAPTAVADDGGSTREDSTAPIGIDALKAGAPAGTPGKDTDPEGDPLTIDPVDATSVRGASIRTGADDTLAYDPNGAFESLASGQTVTDRFAYQVRDSLGAQSAPATVTVAVEGQNDAPSIGEVGAGGVNVGAGAIASDATPRVSATLTVSDPDTGPDRTGATLQRATVRIADGFDADHGDTLNFTPHDGITGSYDPAAGVLTLSGAAAPASYQAALRSVTFTTESTTPAGDRTVMFRVDDGAPEDNLSNAVSRTLSISEPAASVAASPGLTPAFAPGVTDYAVRCTDGDPVDVTVNGPAGTSVSVDGRPAGDASVDLDPSQGFTFRVTRLGSSGVYHVRCLPSDFPAYTATVAGTPQAQWYLIAPSIGAGAAPYNVIFDNQGVPVWWQRHGQVPVDFKLLSNGNVGAFSEDGGGFKPFDEFRLDGTKVRTTSTVDALTDSHDYVELPNGNRYLMSYKERDHVDVSAFTGKAEDTDAAVQDAEVQEIAPDGSLVYKWNSSTHIPLADTGRWWPSLPPAQTGDGRNLYDIAHINSIEPDGDGFIISNRHQDAIYRIDKATGGVNWKLGGTTTPQSLTIVDDDANAATSFGGQHDARILPDGTLALHDNGTGQGRAPRAVRYQLDLDARTATLIESVSDPDVTGSFCCGSARKLPTGNWVMSWGGQPVVTELSGSGDRPFKLQFAPGVFSYRADPVMPGRLSATALRAGMDAQHRR